MFIDTTSISLCLPTVGDVSVIDSEKLKASRRMNAQDVGIEEPIGGGDPMASLRAL